MTLEEILDPTAFFFFLFFFTLSSADCFRVCLRPETMHCCRQQRDDKMLNGHAFRTDGEGCSDDFDMPTTLGVSPAQPAHEVQTNIYLVFTLMYRCCKGRQRLLVRGQWLKLLGLELELERTSDGI